MRLAACASSSGRAALPRVAVLSRAPWSRGTAAREQGVTHCGSRPRRRRRQPPAVTGSPTLTCAWAAKAFVREAAGRGVRARLGA